MIIREGNLAQASWDSNEGPKALFSLVHVTKKSPKTLKNDILGDITQEQKEPST